MDMPLPFLAIMVVAGVALVVAVVAWSGLSQPARIASKEDARSVFGMEFPDIATDEALVTADGRTALLHCGVGQVGVVAAFGSKFVVRLYDRSDFRHIEFDDDGMVRMQTDDFTFSAMQLRFAEAGEADRLAGWLEENHA